MHPDSNHLSDITADLIIGSQDLPSFIAGNLLKCHRTWGTNGSAAGRKDPAHTWHQPYIDG